MFKNHKTPLALTRLVLVLSLALSLPVSAQMGPLVCAEQKTNYGINTKLPALSAAQSQHFDFLKKSFKDFQISTELFLIIDTFKSRVDDLLIEPRINDPERIQILVQRSEHILQQMRKSGAHDFVGIPLTELEKLVTAAQNLGEEFKKEQSTLGLFNLYFFYLTSSLELKAKLGPQPCGMRSEEVFAIFLYTGSAFSYINASLRSETNLESLKFYIDTVNSGLRKLAPYVGTVSRGSELPQSEVDKHVEGQDVVYKAFTSTSIHKSFTGTYSFTIESKTGRYVAPIAMRPEEEEVLIPSNTSFQIIEKDGTHFHLQEN